ncbi:hypothetical protein RBH29_15255 [Herbivorax sp. ANBcel31]|uniref:hypothetical protein n=1 Tax=Herbivorax sp. ANBcel31 TaxID=3069754 RepID=UPI0027ADC467|nr:hypothetical protein [Herbivorax sp. ANBcel31]MDQ2087787.1 hypothetical protein [Herbivorax sp. ANBcel31]
MNKKIIMIISFCLGVTIFAVTVFADIVSKTGYDQLKDSIKHTGATLGEDLDSFTMESEFLIKSNGKTFYSMNEANKYDFVNDRTSRNISETSVNGTNISRYAYGDRYKNINYHNMIDDSYKIQEYTDKLEHFTLFNDPFQEENFKDIERIFDALVGNLRNHVIVEENTDGSKYFSGSVGDAQIPTLINAVSSYFFKQFIINDYEYSNLSLPIITEDVFIQEISGRATTNSDGIVESIFSTFVMSGKDSDDNIHDITLEVIVKIVDINSTIVEEPDLTGKKVTVVSTDRSQNQLDERYKGEWKSEVVIDGNNHFEKIGERFIEITSVEDNYMYGKYYSIYNEDYIEHNREFEFKAEMTSPRNGTFEALDSSEIQGYIRVERGQIYFSFKNANEPESLNYDRYQRVFDY